MTAYEAKGYYQDKAAATTYAGQYHNPLKPSTLTAKIIGAREQKLFTRMLNQLRIPKGKVLDIASGTGRFTEMLLQEGYQVGGVDISDEMLSFARERIGENPNLLFLKTGDAEKIDAADNEYDLVTCMRLYQRIPLENLRPMLREVKRVGKGEAILFFGMTNTWLRMRQSLRNKIVGGRCSCPYPLTMPQIKEEIQAAGLHIKDSARVLSIVSGGMVALVTWDNA